MSYVSVITLPVGDERSDLHTPPCFDTHSDSRSCHVSGDAAALNEPLRRYTRKGRSLTPGHVPDGMADALTAAPRPGDLRYLVVAGLAPTRRVRKWPEPLVDTRSDANKC